MGFGLAGFVCVVCVLICLMWLGWFICCLFRVLVCDVSGNACFTFALVRFEFGLGFGCYRLIFEGLCTLWLWGLF